MANELDSGIRSNGVFAGPVLSFLWRLLLESLTRNVGSWRCLPWHLTFSETSTNKYSIIQLTNNMVLYKGVIIFSIHHPKTGTCPQRKAVRKSLPSNYSNWWVHRLGNDDQTNSFIHITQNYPQLVWLLQLYGFLKKLLWANHFLGAHFGYGLVPRPNKLQPLKPSTRSKACALKTQNRYLLQLSELTLLSRSEDGEHGFFSNHSWSYTSYFDFPLLYLVFLTAEKMTKNIIITKKLGVQNMFIVATDSHKRKETTPHFPKLAVDATVGLETSISIIIKYPIG